MKKVTFNLALLQFSHWVESDHGFYSKNNHLNICGHLRPLFQMTCWMNICHKQGFTQTSKMCIMIRLSLIFQLTIDAGRLFHCMVLNREQCFSYFCQIFFLKFKAQHRVEFIQCQSAVSPIITLFLSQRFKPDLIAILEQEHLINI